MFLATRLLIVICLSLVPWTAQAQFFSSSSDEFLPVHEAFSATAWHDGERVYVGMENADGYYLYRHRFALALQDGSGELGELTLPPGEAKTDEFLGDVNVFYDSVVFSAPLNAPQQGPLPLSLTFQGCADAGLCYPPETLTLSAPESEPPPAFADAVKATGTPSADTPSASASDADVSAADDNAFASAPISEDGHFRALMQNASLPLMLGLFFLAGLGLTFTPCVLPMIPILSSIIVGQNPGRGRAFVLSASYVAGMAFTYALVGVLMGLFGAGLNLQARLQSAPVLIVFALLFTLFALAMFGVFELRVGSRLGSRIDAWQSRAQQSGPLGLAAAGALSVLVVSPCVSAPLAGALVFISSTGDALVGGAALLALGLGMGVPLLLVGGFGTSLLPRSGHWMNGVKTAFGILLLGVAIWLVERLLPATASLLLWACLATGTALTLGALDMRSPTGWPRVRQGLGIILLVWGITLVVGAAGGASDPLRPLQGLTSPSNAGSAGGTQAVAHADQVVTGLDQLEAGLAQDQGPVFVNVTAEWCISCKIMERDVFPDPQVQAALDGYRWIDVDVTESNADSRALLDQLGLFGPPSLLFFHNGTEIRQARIQGELDAASLAQHLDAVTELLTATPAASASATPKDHERTPFGLAGQPAQFSANSALL
ncbi:MULTISPECIES: protein-disulfide reductase DsbD [Halomonas]|uniref:protein-disulfide reductase DsbD n=1 Tax=Halomonas TaxID=2745 RepID=UPI001C9432C1|nr:MULTISPECIES: protein-disulfide reductase DsbD [Halomonas]MBY6209283.1 protein-disulfide reductase DsbD [Halomonas sp. DP3Y7-2]MBY6229438.1 protein-disulfide reductase DsbD [Halomonas sp. DP3Y7-1]MCA0917499.1 protein-disulfide reductase DsbD [Halomonas denitrificans]